MINDYFLLRFSVNSKVTNEMDWLIIFKILLTASIDYLPRNQNGYEYLI